MEYLHAGLPTAALSEFSRMNTQAYESIAQFCVEQYGRFDAQAWKRRGAADRKLVAVAAKYLSMTSWFGYESELEHISKEIDGGLADSTEFNRELGAIGLDLALFSASVRCGIAARKYPQLKQRPQTALQA
jgi:hypothetical protein